MNHEERARKWLGSRLCEVSDEEGDRIVDGLAAQFAEVEAPWTETYNACHNAGGYVDQIRRMEFDAVSLRHHIDNQKARIAILEKEAGPMCPEPGCGLRVYHCDREQYRQRIALLEAALEKADAIRTLTQRQSGNLTYRNCSSAERTVLHEYDLARAKVKP